jgi:hypothetical protein
MAQYLKEEVTVTMTEQERMSLQIVSLEYLKSIARHEAENGEDKTTAMIKETLQSSIKKLESAKLEAEILSKI